VKPFFWYDPRSRRTLHVQLKNPQPQSHHYREQRAPSCDHYLLEDRDELNGWWLRSNHKGYIFFYDTAVTSSRIWERWSISKSESRDYFGELMNNGEYVSHRHRRAALTAARRLLGYFRMVKLGREIIRSLSKTTVLKKSSDEFRAYWFQSLGCVLGFDWHSRAFTPFCALKRGLAGERRMGSR